MIGFNKALGSVSLQTAGLVSHWRCHALPGSMKRGAGSACWHLVGLKAAGSLLLQLWDACWEGKPQFCNMGSPHSRIMSFPASKLSPHQGYPKRAVLGCFAQEASCHFQSTSTPFALGYKVTVTLPGGRGVITGVKSLRKGHGIQIALPDKL